MKFQLKLDDRLIKINLVDYSNIMARNLKRPIVMSWLMDLLKFKHYWALTIVLTLVTFFPLTGSSNLACKSVFNFAVKTAAKTADNSKGVSIPHNRFVELLRAMRNSLSGKLATVWRSEWKTKLSVVESNQLVHDLISQLLSPETSAIILRGLDVNVEGFTRSVHIRMYELQKSGKAQDLGVFSVRDAPPPEGVQDSTFTYYTKSIVDAEAFGAGKHQLRIRGYLRSVNFSKLTIGETVQAFSSNGSPMSITRTSQQTFSIVVDGNVRELSLNELNKTVGAVGDFFAPHGSHYKLEVKTALLDQIVAAEHPNLAGDHMVQKLDVPISFQQFDVVFGPLKGVTPAEKTAESLSRVEVLRRELIGSGSVSLERADGVSKVLVEGINNDPNFLTVLGATYYRRSGFESSLGFQFTVDRSQRVYDGNMYQNPVAGQSRVKTPMMILNGNVAKSSTKVDARHAEFKWAVHIVQQLLGIVFSDPQSASMVPNTQVQGTLLLKALNIYYRYVKSPDHPGKFNYLRENGRNEKSEPGSVEDALERGRE